jgi:hypothetical protein
MGQIIFMQTEIHPHYRPTLFYRPPFQHYVFVIPLYIIVYYVQKKIFLFELQHMCIIEKRQDSSLSKRLIIIIIFKNIAYCVEETIQYTVHGVTFVAVISYSVILRKYLILSLLFFYFLP